MAHCEKCGHKISEEMTYCENCGTKTHFAEEKLKAEKKKQTEQEQKEKERQKIEEEKERLKQEKEREKDIKLKQEKRKEFFNKLKKPKIFIPLLVGIVVLLVLFLPVRTESYKVTVPYQRQESYPETEPYQETEYYNEQLSYSITNKDDCTTTGIFAWKKATYGIYIVNTDSQAGTFDVSITFHLDGGGTLSDSVSHYLTQGNGDWFRVEDGSIKWDGVVNGCDSYVSPQVVQKSRIVTKYRTVTKYKTVTDYRDETRYKKVNWLFRFDQYFGIVIS